MLRNGLYYLQDIDAPENSEYDRAVNNSCKISDTVLWHNRLGHAPLPKMFQIPQLKSSLTSTDVPESVTCPLARFTKLSMSLSTSHAQKPFELMHADIWGPYRVFTRNKYKYFLTLVDDCSRMIWVYLLQFKSVFLATLKTFCQYVSNQFSLNVKILRTDNALEFQDNHCQIFYSASGIVHQTTCIYKPQQNTRVERGHRYILEMSRALKFQFVLDIHYWGDCVLTSVYIINRLPSSLHRNQYAYEKLYNKPPAYDEFKAFGCLAYATNTAASTEKFAIRGLPCVFIAYPPATKGYRLLSLINKSIFISRYVIFKEHIFPYNKSFIVDHNYMIPLPVSMPLVNSVGSTSY